MRNVNEINAFDVNGLKTLKSQASDRSPGSIKAVAQQFEALFLQMVLKNMREAGSMGEGLFNNETTKMYQGMLDQQMSLNLSKTGSFGLAQMIEKQMSPQNATQPPRDLIDWKKTLKALPLPSSTSKSSDSQDAVKASSQKSVDTKKTAFVDKIWSAAQAAAQKIGVPAHFLVAQAALETGWGQHELRNPDGSQSFNLFNIKASASWQGEDVATRTREYVDGKAQTHKARFRSYSSYEEAFEDYAKLMKNSGRYQEVVGSADAAGFARALQKGGYATDPAYADKLTRVINGNTLRVALAQQNLA